MAKRGSLSKIEKFYIEKNADLPINQIAEDLDRHVGTVRKHLLARKTVEKKATVEKSTEIETKVEDDKQTVETKQGITVGDVMIRNKKYGVSIMTQAASEISDATRQSRKVQSRNMEGVIHRPLD